MTADEVITYIWLGQAFLVLIPYQGADPDVRAMVRSGNVVYELVRPTNLYLFWYSRAIAQRTAPGVFRALPHVHHGRAFLQPANAPQYPGDMCLARIDALCRPHQRSHHQSPDHCPLVDHIWRGPGRAPE